jgi:hypothetical protein
MMLLVYSLPQMTAGAIAAVIGKYQYYISPVSYVIVEVFVCSYEHSQRGIITYIINE